jgi:hypothetical protein
MAMTSLPRSASITRGRSQEVLLPWPNFPSSPSPKRTNTFLTHLNMDAGILGPKRFGFRNADLGVTLVAGVVKYFVTRVAVRCKCKEVTQDQFHQHSMYSFYACRSQKRKNSVKLSVSFYAFGIRARKSCAKNVDEIDTHSLICPTLKALNCATTSQTFYLGAYF